MKKTVVIDTFSIGGFHEMFNASFLCVILNSSTGPVDYIADKSAIMAIQQLLKKDHYFQDSADRITFKSKALPKGLSFYAIFLRYLYGTVLNIFYLYKFRRHRVIFPALNPIFSNFLKIILRIFKIEAYVVCHGELGYLFSSHKIVSPLFWYTSFLRPFFNTTLPPNLKLIILGPSIVQNFSKQYPHLVENIVTMHHPYIFNELPEYARELGPIIKFGWVGVATEAKGFSSFDEITQYFFERYPTRFSAHLIGWHSFEIQDYPHLNFVSEPHVFLDRDRFDIAVQELDYILFFYNNEHYRYTASGAIFDAIQHGKLIIALRNDYFESIFNASGPIGFLCDSKEEMLQVIEAVISGQIDVGHFFVNLGIARNIFNCHQMKIIF